MKQKLFSVLLSSVLHFFFVFYVGADTTSSLSADKINSSDSSIQSITLNLSNNSGIMGFKLHFEYPADCVEIISCEKGLLTKKCNFNDNLGKDAGEFDILWNNTSQVTENGSVAVLKCKVLNKNGFKIDVSYSQADTFNEAFEDVVLTCSPIVTDNYTQLETEQDQTKENLQEELKKEITGEGS